MIISILGKPGSGKGTQAELLSRNLKLPIIAVGNILRNLEKNNSSLAKKIKGYINKGKILPDDITLGIIRKDIDRFSKRGLIFDGFPRTLYQAKKIEKFAKPDMVVYLDISDKKAVERLSNRFECRCGEVYNMLTRHPKRDMICDKCGRHIYRRADDYAGAVNLRLKLFNTLTVPVLKFYKRKKRVIRISADKGTRMVQSDILKKIRKML